MVFEYIMRIVEASGKYIKGTCLPAQTETSAGQFQSLLLQSANRVGGTSETD